MTSQPPPPPGGPGHEPPQQPQPQQPQPGQQPWGQQPPPPPQQPWGQQPQQPWGQQPQGGPGQTARSRSSLDFSRVPLFDRLIAGSALLFTLFMLLPWYGLDDGGLEGVDASTNGFNDSVGFAGFSVDIGYATWPAVLAWLLLVAAAAWALLPLFTTVRVPVPSTFVTAGLTGLALLLFLITWIDQLGLADGPGDEVGFSVIAFLALLTVIGAFVLALLRALPDLRARKATGGAQPAAGHGPVGQPQPPQQWQQPQQTQQWEQPPAAPPVAPPVAPPPGTQPPTAPPPAGPGQPGGPA
jgi:hypothetical protein